MRYKEVGSDFGVLAQSPGVSQDQQWLQVGWPRDFTKVKESKLQGSAFTKLCVVPSEVDARPKIYLCIV